MALRIMHVVNNLGRGGLENGLVNLTRHLDPRRFEHVICAIRGLGPSTERLPRDRVQVRALDEAASASRLQLPALVRAIRDVRPDVVHSRNWGAIEAVLAARIARVRGVIHSEHGFEAAASVAEPWRRRGFRRIAYEAADRVLTVSSQLRDLHAARTGFRASRISVIHNGVDCSRFSPDPAIRRTVRNELGIAETALCVGSVGNLLPVKDHNTLLESLAVLDSRRVDWQLLLIGEGPERARLQAFVDGRGWQSRVRLLGSSHRVPDLLRAMDVFVLPSLAEGMCNALLEAMATGLPSIVTAVGGNPEVVVDGESGLLWPAGDCQALAVQVERVWEDPGLRARLGQGALRRVRDQFSLESMVQAYEKLYRNVRPATGVPQLSAS